MQTNITKNSRKNVAVIAAVSVVFGVMIGLGIQTSDALLPTDPNYGLIDPRFGVDIHRTVEMVMAVEETDTIEEMDHTDPVAPSGKVVSIHKYKASPNKHDVITYKITYRVSAGAADLKDIQIHAVTDMGEWDYEISSLNAGSSSINVAMLKALNPDSITGEIIGYTVTGPTDRTAQFPR